MPFAVQLFFDPSSDALVRSLWEAEADAGVPFPLRDSGNRPHLSLAIYGELDVPVCTNLLNSFVQTRSLFPLSIASLGIFSGEKMVVFLAPTINSNFFHLHEQVHQLLQGTGKLPNPLYLPGHWTPHCTLATRVPPHLLSQAVAIGLSMPFPLPVSLEEIGVIEYPPVNHLFSFRFLGG